MKLSHLSHYFRHCTIYKANKKSEKNRWFLCVTRVRKIKIQWDKWDKWDMNPYKQIKSTFTDDAIMSHYGI